MRSRILTIAAGTAAALLLTGCGTTAPADDHSPAAAGTSLTVTDSRGTAVHLDGPAKRVIGTEWNVVENLVDLGVMPVGVADVKGYGEWVKAAPLKGKVTDIGTRGEPSIDAVAALKPDLILGTTDLSGSAITQLEAIAPVIVVRSADASRQIRQMIDNLQLVAKATGTEAKATAIVDDFDAALAAGKATLAKAGFAGARFAFADGWKDGNQVSVRPYVKGSLMNDVAERLGLVGAWKLEGDKDYGLASTDVEGLTALGDVQFLYITNDVDGDPFVDGLADNAIWKRLPFVVDHQVHRLADGIWMFGGPASMTQYVDAVVAALTA